MLPKERDIAMVFQNYALYPHMTVRDNMAFSLTLAKQPKALADERVRKAAGILGLEPLLDRYPRQLSGGQRQRVAMGRCIVRDPQVFLFDEPLSNLDAKLRVQMRTEIKELHQRLKTTSVYVTHDQIEAMTMGERICIMKDGRIVQVGEPLEVYRNPANTFVAGFLASPPMNLIDGRLVADSAGALRLEAGGVALTLPPAIARGYQPYAGKPVILGFRPEDVHEEPAQPTWLPIEGSVVALEALGSEVILVLGLGGPPAVEISAKLGRDYRAPIGSRQRLYLDSAEIKFFDPQTTNALPRLG
jgi:multiple sugar transport system ATP-binding protein